MTLFEGKSLKLGKDELENLRSQNKNKTEYNFKEIEKKWKEK